MSRSIKLAWGVAILVGLVALVQGTPVEVVYTGEGCDCPRQLDYQLNVPYLPRPKSYSPHEYGYKIDVPVPAKSKVSYTFDFIVEKPLKPRPRKEPEYMLYAKVDRIALNKGDCGEMPNYMPESPPPPPAPSRSYGCGKYASSKPRYRYVNEKVKPCQCQRAQCKCNEQRELATNIIKPIEHIRISAIRPNRRNSRSKRDLRAFFRQHRLDRGEERPGRFIKLYNKSLPSKRQAPTFFQMLAEPYAATQSDAKPARANKYKRTKRDIMGEYDMLEREREQMDLTLPEIVQFMPETLQPDFKRGQCHFGCAAQQQDMPEGSTTEPNKEIPESNDTDTETLTQNELNENANAEKITNEPLVYYKEPPSPNKIESNNPLDSTSSYTKRNAAQFYQGSSQLASETLTTISAPQLPTYSEQYDYRMHRPPHLNPAQQLSNAYVPPASSSQQPQYGYDHLGQKYVEQNGRLRLINTSPTVPDVASADGTPLQYVGDLNAPPSSVLPSHPSQQYQLLGGPRYPVRTLSNSALDKVIADIVFRHPDFIDASSHYGGALVDPEPWQKQETKEFLKKLIAGRLRLWFGDEEQHFNPYHTIGYDSPHRPYRQSTPVLGYFPITNQS